MAGKDSQGRGIDIFDDIATEFDNTSKRVGYQENRTRAVAPRYNFLTDDPGDKPLNPAEGQLAVGSDSNNLQFYVNGEWREVTADTFAGRGIYYNVASSGDWLNISVGLPTDTPPETPEAGSIKIRAGADIDWFAAHHIILQSQREITIENAVDSGGGGIGIHLFSRINPDTGLDEKTFEIYTLPDYEGVILRIHSVEPHTDIEYHIKSGAEWIDDLP